MSCKITMQINGVRTSKALVCDNFINDTYTFEACLLIRLHHFTIFAIIIVISCGCSSHPSRGRKLYTSRTTSNPI